jgi:L-ascorbate metabolism protein UlaG (beta-lactamase superfamily)
MKIKSIIRKIKIIKSIHIFVLLVLIFLPACSIWHSIKPVPPRDHDFSGMQNSITWVGHATTLIQLDGINIITDPMYNDYILLFVKRHYEPGVKFEKLPPIDVIAVSHEHYDHMDDKTLLRFNKVIPALVSVGNGYRLERLGFRHIHEMKWWDSLFIGNVKITAVPAKHGKSRCSGFIFEGSHTIFFAGDTALFEGFEEIGQIFDIDIALLPIGEYRSAVNFFGMNEKLRESVHMGPPDVPDAIKMLRCRTMIPIHHGTFDIMGMMSVGLHRPAEHLREIVREEGLENQVRILELGEQVFIDDLIK